MRWRLGAAFVLLCASPGGAEIMCLSTRQANVREGAALEFPVAWVAERHTPFEVLGWEDDWANVKDIDGYTGWTHKSVLSSGPCAIIAGKRANVRSGPGLEHEVLWDVEHGYPFRVLQSQGDWIQVSDDGKVEGWVFVRLLWGDLGQAGGNG